MDPRKEGLAIDRSISRAVPSTPTPDRPTTDRMGFEADPSRTLGCRPERRCVRSSAPLLGLAVFALSIWTQACAPSAWQSAVSQDTPAAYHRYLRTHPNSRHSEEARERLAFRVLMGAPSFEGYLEFARAYPNSSLARELEPVLEEQAFAAAMAENTASAYREFIHYFPGSSYVPRADGNTVYLQAGGFGGDPAALGAFASVHPQSDYAAESRRTVETLSLRTNQRIDRMGLRIQIQPGLPEMDRLVSTFSERAKAYYDSVGIELVPIRELRASSEVDLPSTAILTIHHTENAVRSQIADGSFSQPGRQVDTTVFVDLGDDRIASRQTSFRLTARDVVGDGAAVFSPAAAQYWEDFFVPVVSWPTRNGVRDPYDLSQKSVAVDAAADRVVVLFENGGFQVFGLANPSSPALLAEYQRPQSFDSWRGVRILDTGIVLFGEDGLEIVRVGESSFEAHASYGRGEIGSIAAIEPVEGGMLLAGSRGIALMPDDGEPTQRILRRVTRALAADAEDLFFSDGDTLFISTLEKLQKNELTGQLRLGRDFAAHGIRTLGSWIAVLGEEAVSLVDVSNPEEPVMVSRLSREDAGRVEDAVEIAGRIFLLGHRGLQLLDLSGQQVVEHISVIPASRMARMGRHLTMVGPRSMQVVDSVPFTAPVVPASLAGDAAAR